MAFWKWTASLVVLCVMFFTTKLTANYSGVCTQGANPFAWHIVSAQEYVDFMNRKRVAEKPTQRLYRVYSVGPDPTTIPGDHKESRWLSRMVMGNQKDLIQIDMPNCST